MARNPDNPFSQLAYRDSMVASGAYNQPSITNYNTTNINNFGRGNVYNSPSGVPAIGGAYDDPEGTNDMLEALKMYWNLHGCLPPSSKHPAVLPSSSASGSARVPLPPPPSTSSASAKKLELLPPPPSTSSGPVKKPPTFGTGASVVVASTGTDLIDSDDELPEII